MINSLYTDLLLRNEAPVFKRILEKSFFFSKFNFSLRLWTKHHGYITEQWRDVNFQIISTCGKAFKTARASVVYYWIRVRVNIIIMNLAANYLIKKCLSRFSEQQQQQQPPVVRSSLTAATICFSTCYADVCIYKRNLKFWNIIWNCTMLYIVHVTLEKNVLYDSKSC